MEDGTDSFVELVKAMREAQKRVELEGSLTMCYNRAKKLEEAVDSMLEVQYVQNDF